MNINCDFYVFCYQSIKENFIEDLIKENKKVFINKIDTPN